MSVVRPPHSRWKGTVVAPIESISDLQREQFLEEYAETFDERAARQKASISVFMLRRLLEEDARFREDFEAVRDQLHRHAIEAVEDAEIGYAMRGNNPMSRQFILKHLKGEKYGNRATIDLNVGVFSPEDLKDKTDEELAEIKARALRKA